jgi:hypothetical protein
MVIARHIPPMDYSTNCDLIGQIDGQRKICLPIIHQSVYDTLKQNNSLFVAILRTLAK